MDWQEARNQTLAHWSAIREAVGKAPQVELLTQINVVLPLCEKSKQEAGGAAAYCDRCLFYQQFGGCREVSWKMSERAAAWDWDGLRAMIDEFIAHVSALQVPAGTRAS